MIIEQPTPEDFERSGTSFLNLAWTIVLELYGHTQNNYSAICHEPELSDEFWHAAQRPLSNAVTLVEQGIELLLKARIAEVSPYLLIEGSARDWPRKSASQDTPFAAFRMIDARDLPTLYNTVRSDRLPEAFTQQLSDLRRLRNSIMHTVDPGLRIRPKLVLAAILEAAHQTVGALSWIRLRRDHLYTVPQVVAYSDDHVGAMLVEEIRTTRVVLSKSELARFFGVNKSQRWYICLECSTHVEDDWSDTAQLRPNTARSTGLFCFLCGQTTSVQRRKCAEASCEGNVIAAEQGVCLTCGHEPDEQRHFGAGDQPRLRT